MLVELFYFHLTKTNITQLNTHMYAIELYTFYTESTKQTCSSPHYSSGARYHLLFKTF
jgi:hypothetical protein